MEYKIHFANGCHSECGMVYCWQDKNDELHFQLDCVDEWDRVTCKRCLKKRLK